MATESETTDKGVGLALALGALAVIGALLMLVGAPEITAAWGFAAAVLFSSLAVVGIHLFSY
ncbi:hypothetical protein C488_13488 [Natrinema pellirubrum DSM 15624]|uniref:Uncharacterized protein n=3 Tax=Natrinema TaxID=88723 RepID=A0A1S8AYE4_9EURY|nr:MULTISPECIES: hypothetical protein [Natrinema]ELZ12922.1 hypothetical protein C478_08363 [Natrinema thermotolerans DSM 11552]AGB32682.1 hypothetical protein Natpe_2885 [Natrinema pellirubrum DSM 15624]ELY73816.1 hypothetical protein C488_13488 [Natrinema pellirubrum DSM 15624]OLZ41576.1 hypothetical protein A6E15_11545 [Natrinema saccharevitans]QCC57947.1 hypothetical protein DVR14_04550 [Natrinema thermotolerans]